LALRLAVFFFAAFFATFFFAAFFLATTRPPNQWFGDLLACRMGPDLCGTIATETRPRAGRRPPAIARPLRGTSGSTYSFNVALSYLVLEFLQGGSSRARRARRVAALRFYATSGRRNSMLLRMFSSAP
jgi:hypothetical protein